MIGRPTVNSRQFNEIYLNTFSLKNMNDANKKRKKKK